MLYDFLMSESGLQSMDLHWMRFLPCHCLEKEQRLRRSILVKLLIFYMFVLDPSVSECVINKLKSIRFPYEILCFLDLRFLVEEIFAGVVGLLE
jgi:hypothetical protein